MNQKILLTLSLMAASSFSYAEDASSMSLSEKCALIKNNYNACDHKKNPAKCKGLKKFQDVLCNEQGLEVANMMDRISDLTKKLGLSKCDLRIKKGDIEGKQRCLGSILNALSRIADGPKKNFAFDSTNITEKDFPTDTIQMKDEITSDFPYIIPESGFGVCLKGYTEPNAKSQGKELKEESARLSVECINELVEHRDDIVKELQEADKKRQGNG